MSEILLPKECWCCTFGRYISSYVQRGCTLPLGKTKEEIEEIVTELIGYGTPRSKFRDAFDRLLPKYKDSHTCSSYRPDGRAIRKMRERIEMIEEDPESVSWEEDYHAY